MALISDDIIKKVRESNDIVDVIGSYLPLVQKGKNYFCVCPFHDDHSPSMSISEEKQIFRCFVCGATGNVITFVKDYEKVSFQEAIDILAKKSGIKVDIKLENKEDNIHKEEYEIFNVVTMLYKNNLNSKAGLQAREYLNSRNLTKETIDYFDIGLSLNTGVCKNLSAKYPKEKLVNLGLARNDLSDLFVNRIMFTIKDNNGNPVGFSGRIYTNSNEAKYINSKESEIFKKGKVLYNFYRAKDEIRKKREIIISEGFMEIIRLHTIKIDNAVALMGTSFTKDHLNIIKNLKVDVVLNLDQDEAGKTATIKIGEMLMDTGINPTVIIFSKYKDADELIAKEGSDPFISAYNNRVSFIDFYIDHLKQKKDLTKTEDLSKFIKESLAVIDKIKDDILKELKLKWLSTEYGINIDLLKSKLETKPENKEPKKETSKLPAKKKYNKYDKSEIRLLYLMLNHKEIIKYYETQLGYMNDENRRKLASAIVNYNEIHKTFDYADFICYTNESLNEVLKEITMYPELETYTMEEVDDYITRIKEQRVKKTINKLTEKLKNTLDIEEKKKLANRIENMKKEVLKW